MSKSSSTDPIIFDHVKGEVRRGRITTIPSYVLTEAQAELKQLREDYRALLTAHHNVQYEALQEYLNSSEDGKRTIDAARRWIAENE